MVIVDIDNSYEDDLAYGYQLCKDEDGRYFVWVDTGLLSGYKSGPKEGFDYFSEAWDHLNMVIQREEFMG